MATFYFTYGSDPSYPYEGGWTEVVAPSRHAAIELFRSVHPDGKGRGLINCADIYDDVAFAKTGMDKSGNFGKFAWESIITTIERYRTNEEHDTAREIFSELAARVDNDTWSVLEDAGIFDIFRRRGLHIEHY